jgi:hypothetical protein
MSAKPARKNQQTAEQDLSIEELRESLARDDSETESATDSIAEPTPTKAEGEDFEEYDER